HRPKRAQAKQDLLRADAGDGEPGGESAPGAVGRVSWEARSASPRALYLSARFGYSRYARGGHHGGGRRPERYLRWEPNQAFDLRGPRSAGDGCDDPRGGGSPERDAGHDLIQDWV